MGPGIGCECEAEIVVGGCLEANRGGGVAEQGQRDCPGQQRCSGWGAVEQEQQARGCAHRGRGGLRAKQSVARWACIEACAYLCGWLAGLIPLACLPTRCNAVHTLRGAACPPPPPPSSQRAAAAGGAGRVPHAASAAAARAGEAPCALGRWVPGERKGGKRGGRTSRGVSVCAIWLQWGNAGEGRARHAPLVVEVKQKALTDDLRLTRGLVEG